MEFLASILDLFLNLDAHLAAASDQYGVWIYALLFAVLFAETGLVVTPFLPGDSLLLTAGVLAGTGTLDIGVLMAAVLVAPMLGDSVNYWTGRLAGKGIIASGRVIKRSYVDRTAAFFERHGGKTITIARFFPIVRTFAPFMAGVGRMDYGRFLVFSVGGTLAWTGLFTLGGYFFGRIPGVAENLEYAVLFVLSLSIIPAGWHWWQKRRDAAAGKADAPGCVQDTPPCDELTEIEHAIDVAEHRR